MSDSAAVPNALINESSPYLRQHAHNPVQWLPWGEAAFAEARRRQVPVLVSIGYSTCHWCHVMAHECFEDRTTAELMNDALVCIKVDREEHPEVDEIYMDAVQAMTGHGGWPLNAFTDHSGRPFFTCTYVPRPSWQQLIGQIGEVWAKEPERIAKVAAEVVTHLRQEGADGGAMNARVWNQLDGQLKRIYDPENPGYAFGGGKAPKFPSSQLLPVMLASGRQPWVAQAEAVLEAMQDAGLHDRVGGGFHRYSVDAAWRLPHFEKMLYDNAQLMGVYARAGVQLGRPDFLRTAVNTGDYLLRDLRLADTAGGFAGLAAAEDADDPDGEGSFYAWSPDQLTAVLGPVEGAQLAKEWDTRPGHAEIGHSGHPEPVTSHIPHPRGADLKTLAPGGDIQALRLRWEPLLPRLRAVRDRRPRPGRDDKIITDLNALALEGFAALGRFTGEERFIAACRDLVGLLASRHGLDGLLRLPKRTAYITDYGHLVSALTAAFDLLGDPALIAAAARAADEAIARLRADDGGFYTTPAGRGDLVRRSREQTDNAYPSGQNALAVGLMRLWNLTGLGRWRAIAEGIFTANASAAQQAPTATATLLSAWQQAERGHFTAVVGGDPADPLTRELLAACRRSPLAGLGIVPVAACREQPWTCLEGRRDLARPQALICVGTVCLAPAFTAAEVAERLAAAVKA